MMVTAHKHTLRALFDGFLLAKEADGVSKYTIGTYQVMFQNLVRDFPPEKLEEPSQLTSQDFQEWVVGLRQRVATATVDQRISKVKTFFNWCVAEGFLDDNPAKVLKRPKKNWQPDPLSSEEVDILLQAARHGHSSARNYAILCVLLDSGMRNGELAHLRPSDVSIKTGEIKIYGAKGGKSRTVLIGKRAKEALWRWMMQRPDNAEYLFCTRDGRPLIRERLAFIVRHIGERVGIKVYPHRLRHTFALMFLKNGGDPYTLQYLLGHEDMTVTREYVKIAATDVKDMYKSPLDAL
ncbi:MAG: tyrosine-type recombinase/integrase [Anaerolineae bacterium]|jgi:integrase/recombinase XerD